MSPLLFTIYIDELLLRLQKSKCGCFIGNTFCGAMGYADDVVLLAPTATSLRNMLRICLEYGKDYNVLFNPDKTKLIIYTGREQPYKCPKISFAGKYIEPVAYDKHLGFPVGNITPAYIMTQAINDFLVRVNMVKSHFNHLPPDVIYRLFKTYCMPLYGCPLWDYSKKSIDRFYVTWRKAIRSILYIPRTTHCNLLHLICEDIPVKDQLYQRFVRFIGNAINSHNQVTKLCATLAQQGSSSSVANNITTVSHYFGVSRYDVHHINQQKFKFNYNDASHVTASAITELLETKYVYAFKPNDFFVLSRDECNLLLNWLCTM